MIIDVYHTRWYDWELMHISDIPKGVAEDAVRHTHRPKYKQVRVEYDEPNQTEFHVPDYDWDLMHETHVQGVRNAAAGYKTKHLGEGDGFEHGSERQIAPRNLPLKTKGQVLAEHLQLALTNHAHPSTVTKVVFRVPPAEMSDEDVKKLEQYLTVVLSGGGV